MMRYPILSHSKMQRLVDQLAHGDQPAVEPHVEWVGAGTEVDLNPIAAAAGEIEEGALTWTDKDRDRFEGKAAVALASALGGVVPEVLDDRGFWRYLSVRYFWAFIAWREAEAFERGNHEKYVDAVRSTESVLTRMYLRAQAIGRRNPELASAIPDGTDFWRSHVIRVRSGSAPPITRALVKSHSEERLSTDLLRQAAKSLNRTWANVVLHVYEDSDAERLVGEIWDSYRDG